MCGIAGVYLLDDSLKVNLDAMLDTLLEEIEHRGGDATGFVALGDEGVLEWQKASCNARDFAHGRRRVPQGTRTLLAHTRWATQGSPAFMENNHPLKRGAFFAIHNGHVSNDHKLFELAERTRYGQVDSEAIPARLASFGSLDALQIVMEEIEGSAAVAAVDESKPRDLALARGSQSPLLVLRTKKIVVFGSTHTTVKAAYEKHVGKLPKRAKIETLKQGTLMLFSEGTLKRVAFKPYTPVYVKPMPNVVLPWKDVLGPTPKELNGTSWDTDDEDHGDCDACGTSVKWTAMTFREDEQDGMTYQFCGDCGLLYDWDPKWAREDISASVVDAEYTEDVSAVSRAIIAKFEETAHRAAGNPSDPRDPDFH